MNLGITQSIGQFAYTRGERNMQDSYALELNQLRKTTKEYLKNFLGKLIKYK